MPRKHGVEGPKPSAGSAFDVFHLTWVSLKDFALGLSNQSELSKTLAIFVPCLVYFNVEEMLLAYRV